MMTHLRLHPLPLDHPVMQLQLAICRSLKKRRRKHGAADMKDRSMHLIPDHMDPSLLQDSSSLSSDSGSFTTSAEVNRITDRLMEVETGSTASSAAGGGGSAAGGGKSSPILQLTLLPEGLLLPLGSREPRDLNNLSLFLSLSLSVSGVHLRTQQLSYLVYRNKRSSSSVVVAA